jgi:hypothetical protein
VVEAAAPARTRAPVPRPVQFELPGWWSTDDLGPRACLAHHALRRQGRRCFLTRWRRGSEGRGIALHPQAGGGRARSDDPGGGPEAGGGDPGAGPDPDGRAHSDGGHPGGGPDPDGGRARLEALKIYLI